MSENGMGGMNRLNRQICRSQFPGIRGGNMVNKRSEHINEATSSQGRQLRSSTKSMISQLD
jgi:hypothetical protein